jgi:tetratricopeptide (TPR) repeat protein
LRPEHPVSAVALGQLAAELGVQGKRTEQRAALRRALELEPDPAVRAELAVELGRSLLKAEQPRAAIEVLSVAGSDAPGSEVWALAEWTLAVAYDLGYDFPQAMRHVIPASQARFGESGQTSLLDIHAVSALLGYEKFYYFALELTARAAKFGEGPQQLQQLQAALLVWLGYRGAAPENDRWRNRAEEHLADIRRALEGPIDRNLDRDALTPPDFSL